MIKLWLQIRFYAIIISAVVAALTLAYAGWQSHVEQAALIKWNEQQTQALIAAQKKYALDREELMTSLEAITADLHSKMEQLETSTKSMVDQLNTPKAIEQEHKSGPSSDVLRDTVKKLGGQK